jgi:hypothetical protein
MTNLHPIKLCVSALNVHIVGQGWTYAIIKLDECCMYPIAHVAHTSGMSVDLHGKIITENEP